MLRSLVLLLAVLLLAPFAGAQEKETRDSINQKAIDALVAKKFDEGIALFQRVLEMNPKDKGTAYNLACAHSLKGDVDKSLEWIEKAAEWGWGEGEGTIYGREGRMSELDMLKQDADLENVRKDPRFEAVMAKMAKAGEVREARRKKADEYSATAAVYIPEKAKGLAETPILCVIHDTGSTKDAVVAGRWKDIADELGFALIAPSGKILVGEEPEKGMAWFDSLASYKANYKLEKPVTDALTAFKKEHPFDKARVVIAGEGIGGLVALNAAVNNPGMIKGAVAVNGGPSAELMATKAPTAGKMGLRARVLFDSAVLSKMMTDGGKTAEDGPKVLESWSKLFQTWGIVGETKTFTGDDAATKALIIESIHAVLARDPAPAKTEAPK